MNESRTSELSAIIAKNTAMLVSLYEALERSFENEIRILGRTNNSALIVAGLLENYYTCLETVFLRVSQFFENNLTGDRRHTSLLEKMTIHLEGVRIPVVSQTNYTNLLELLKFRHFRRSYFEIEYDWDRLDFLVRKLRAAHPVVLEDLSRFGDFPRAI